MNPLQPSLGWSGRPTWVILDTDFDNANQFLHTWQAWQIDTQRPGMLHYVGVAAGVPHAYPSHPLAAQLQASCAGLSGGFHRLILDQGKVSLTLCLGPLKDMLDEQHFQADTVFIDANMPDWDKWSVKSLARLCKRGTKLHIPSTFENIPPLFEAAGFRMHKEQAQRAVFDPRWTPSTSRSGSPLPPVAPASCAVIGAGIAGASVANAMAVRGWRVTVFDRNNRPAGEASGLPAGIVAPLLSADDSPRTRVVRAGAHLTLREAQKCLETGQDWAPSGVVEMQWDQTSGPHQGHWHEHAAWLKPASLVRAWLAHDQISFIGDTEVTEMVKNMAGWSLRGIEDRELGTYSIVIVASAMGSARLLQAQCEYSPMSSGLAEQLQALTPLHGSVSSGLFAQRDKSTDDQNPPPFPGVPVNGHGSFIPTVPESRGSRWYAGATFETDVRATANVPAQHRANLTKLKQLLPKVGAALEPAFAQGLVEHWSGTRCVSHDRLPLVGSLSADNTLLLSTAFGSRGLAFSMLCAQLVAACVGAEPLPLEHSLARRLHPGRVMRKATERAG